MPPTYLFGAVQPNTERNESMKDTENELLKLLLIQEQLHTF